MVRGATGGSRTYLRRVGAALVASAAIAGSVLAASPAAADSTTPQPAVVGPTTDSPSANAPLGLAGIETVIGADQSQAAGDSGQGVDVALLDSGVSPVAGLDAPGKVVYGPDLSFDSQNPATANIDNFGHGTAMAGLIAGNDPGDGGYSGVAPGARIVSVKVGAANGAVDVSQIIAGIDWVTQHAHSDGLNVRVLDLSLGTDSLQPYQLDPLAHAAEVAWRHGIVVVAAVGNQGGSATSVSDPATDPYLIDVGASDPNGTVSPTDDVVADFSSVGTPDRHADLVAPGAYVVGPRDPGSFLDQMYPAARIGDTYFRGSGTSQATALTAGAVADLLSEQPGLNPDTVKALLTSTATPMPDSSPLAVGSGELNLAAAEAVQNPAPARQRFMPSLGLGSLEAARGDAHVSIAGTVLTGQQDIFGHRWSPLVPVAEELGVAWRGGTYNGNLWAGSSWSATSAATSMPLVTWASATWSSATWSSATWSSATWSSATWSSATWSSATWSGATWSGATWS